MKTLNFFNIYFNEKENKCLSLAYRCKNDVAVINRFDTNGVSILSLRKHAFADRVSTSMLIFRKQSIHMQ